MQVEVKGRVNIMLTSSNDGFISSITGKFLKEM
jgi:hypothetical protein